MKENFTKCPLCSQKIIHKIHSRKDDVAHIWICSECPFVWFEFIKKDQLELLKEQFKPKEKVISEEEKKKNEQIRNLLKIFNDQNPNVGYSNKTYRKIISELLNSIGYDESVEYINSILEFQWKEYAPVIDNPFDMKYKQEKIIRYQDLNN